jgi:hypothetical protein
MGNQLTRMNDFFKARSHRVGKESKKAIFACLPLDCHESRAGQRHLMVCSQPSCRHDMVKSVCDTNNTQNGCGVEVNRM